MKANLVRLNDWLFRYMLAWCVILLAPLWYPVKLAAKIKKWLNEEND